MQQSPLEEEIEALQDLKSQFPDIQFKIEQLKQIKIQETIGLKSKVRAVDSLAKYCSW